jgi:hypothetical protein
MHISSALRETARATLIDRWAHEGFKVPARHNATFRMLWEIAGCPMKSRNGERGFKVAKECGRDEARVPRAIARGNRAAAAPSGH